MFHWTDVHAFYCVLALIWVVNLRALSHSRGFALL